MPESRVRAINRLVLDTNVIVRGTMQPKGPSGLLFEHVVDELVMLVCNESIAELRRVFGYDRITQAVPKALLDRQLIIIEEISEMIEITGLRQVVKDDPDDDKFIELAEVGNADCVVSTDGDLLRLRPIGEGVGQTWADVTWSAGAAGPLPIMRPTELLKAFELGEAV